MLLLSLVVFTFAIASCASAAICTPSEVEVFTDANSTLAPRCVVVLSDFGACTDDCLASFTSVLEKAPACTVSSELSSSTTLLQAATVVVNKCKAARTTVNPSAVYAPKVATPDAPACSATQETEWEAQYGPEYLFGACAIEAKANLKCSAECRDKIQEGVQAAPLCRRGGGDFLFDETVKIHLMDCLRARREPFDTNAVLQTPVTAGSYLGSGTVENSASNSTATMKPSSDAPSLQVVMTTTPPAASNAAPLGLACAVALAALVVMATTLV
jgi:hypothetical protein